MGGSLRDGTKADESIGALGCLGAQRKRERGAPGWNGFRGETKNIQEGKIHELPEVRGQSFRENELPEQLEGKVVVALEATVYGVCQTLGRSVQGRRLPKDFKLQQLTSLVQMTDVYGKCATRGEWQTTDGPAQR